MASYVGSQRNPGHLFATGEHVKRAFNAARHKVVAREVKTFLSRWARYAAGSKRADAAAAREDTARSALADADAARDAAVIGLDRALIVAGEHRMNPFKRFGAPSASRLVQLRYAEATKVVAALVRAVLAQQTVAADVKKAATALLRANDAVRAAEAHVASVANDTVAARLSRDAFDRPLRAALSILKLQVRIAEKSGLPNAYAELFAE